MENEIDSLFQPTRWSLIGRVVSGEEGAEIALAEFCRHYRKPLFHFCRKFSTQPEDAEDLVQEFFLKLLKKNFLALADSKRGRLRTFLLTLLERHIADEYRKETAEKRGGRIRKETIEALNETACGSPNPAEMYHRQWALVVLDRALVALREEWTAQGKAELFEALKPWLGYRDETEINRAAIASELKMSPGAVNTALYRLRCGYRSALLQEIGETLALKTKKDVEEELKMLLGKI
jgi:RNA polymerase sigma factor (sigma-70 family)